MNVFRRISKSIATFALVIVLTACGSNFASQLRLVFLAAPPLVETLPISPALKSGLITDFTDIGGRVADYADCLKGRTNKAGKLECTQYLESQVEIIIARGNFVKADNPRLQRILGLVRGIMASAKIYFGAGGSSRSATGEPVTEGSIKEQIKALKAEMESR